MAVTVAGLPFQFIQLSAASGNTGFFFKSTADAYQFASSTLTKVSDADYPATTVPGVAYLDGTYYVMTPQARIQGSDLENPLSWSALNVIVCVAEPDSGVAIARHMNYIVGFGAYTTEFFYNAGNPTGSPLTRIDNAFVRVGCAAAGSIAQTQNTTIFMGVTQQKGRAIYILEGTKPTSISTPSVDRVLNGDDLASVHAYCVRSNGHTFYVLTLGTLGVTLVYDFTTSKWHEWTTSTVQSTKSVTTLTQVTGVATAICTAHGYADGDPVIIAGATQSGYNGTHNISFVDANTFTFPVDSSLATPATGTKTAAGYTVTYFKNIFYTAAGNLDIVQGESDGNTYTFSTDTYNDNSSPIDVRLRTSKWDGGVQDKKFFKEVEFVGDKSSSYAFLRYSNDDYQTWSAFRRMTLNWDQPRLSRLGAGRRRAFELRHTDSTALRGDFLEIRLGKGVA
jgi:stabilization protein